MDGREKLVRQAISHFSYGVSHDIFSEPVTTYAKLAIEALEKQIPKKLIEKFQVPYDPLECGLCHSCNEGVNSDMDFCSVCGQAIDWRDDE